MLIKALVSHAVYYCTRRSLYTIVPEDPFASLDVKEGERTGKKEKRGGREGEKRKMVAANFF